MCFNALQHILVRDTSLYLEVLDLLPFLKIGVTLAIFQSAGIEA